MITYHQSIFRSIYAIAISLTTQLKLNGGIIAHQRYCSNLCDRLGSRPSSSNHIPTSHPMQLPQIVVLPIQTHLYFLYLNIRLLQCSSYEFCLLLSSSRTAYTYNDPLPDTHLVSASYPFTSELSLLLLYISDSLSPSVFIVFNRAIE